MQPLHFVLAHRQCAAQPNTILLQSHGKPEMPLHSFDCLTAVEDPLKFDPSNLLGTALAKIAS